MFRPGTGFTRLPNAAVAIAAVPLGILFAAAPQKPIDVRWYGALKEIIHEGRTAGRARLADAMVPHGYALGALAGLDGEFVVMDGAAHLTRPDGRGGVRSTVSKAGEDSVALMVAARVPVWRRLRLDCPVPLAALQDTLARHAAGSGLPEGGPFPFIVEGGVTGLHWHVVDGSRMPAGPAGHEAHMRAAVRGERDSATVTLLGFYSDHHAGVFLHHDLDVHVHVLTDEGLAAHVDEVTVAAGAVLRIPRVR